MYMHVEADNSGRLPNAIRFQGSEMIDLANRGHHNHNTTSNSAIMIPLTVLQRRSAKPVPHSLHL